MKYIITSLVDPFDVKLRSDARATLQAYGKLSWDYAANVVDELFMKATNNKAAAIEVDLPDHISRGCMREFHLYLNMVVGYNVPSEPAMITFKLIKLIDTGDHIEAVKTLRDFAELDPDHALSVTKDVAAGHPTEIEVRHSISIGAVKKIREHFEMLDHRGITNKQTGRAVVTATQKKAAVALKLWTIRYLVRGNPLEILALVLAETPLVASESLMKRAAVNEIVLVTEVEGPFVNGHVLTKSMVA